MPVSALYDTRTTRRQDERLSDWGARGGKSVWKVLTTRER